MKMIKSGMSLLALLFSLQAWSQQFSTSILYNISVPVSNTADYLSTTSFRGVTISPRVFLSERFSVGVSAGWQVFYEKRAPEAYVDDNLTLYGTQFRYINAFPLYLSPQFHLPVVAGFKPYAGLGIGTTYVNQTTNMGLYAFQSRDWLPGVYPEVGFTFPFRNDWHLTLSGKYNHMFGGRELPTQAYWGINAGFTHFFQGFRRY
jgi:outer membrane protein W